MKELVEELKKIIENKTSEKIPLFTKKGFEAIKISENNFHNIKDLKEYKTLCFVDGGNSELISANNFSLQFIRVAAVGYKGNKKVFLDKKEFYILINFVENSYKAKILPSNETITFSLNDESLKDGKSIAKISRIGNFIRRIEELKLASEIAEKSDFIIIDGSLEEKFSQEKQFLETLFAKGAFVAGISKTNSLITTSGEQVSNILYNLKAGKWFYYPIAKIESDEFLADIVFAKLNEQSQHIFKIDVHKKEFEELLSQLAANSSDPVFLGYPYGLIEVDRIARVSNKEAEYLKTKLMIEFGKDWEQIRKLENTNNAHKILDSIS